MSKAYASTPLYVDDEQLRKALNLPKGADAEFFKYHEDKSKFPKRDPDFGNKRYYPAVIAWFDAECGLADRRPYFKDDDVEAWKKYPTSKKKRKTRWGE